MSKLDVVMTEEQPSKAAVRCQQHWMVKFKWHWRPSNAAFQLDDSILLKISRGGESGKKFVPFPLNISNKKFPRIFGKFVFHNLFPK